LFIILDDILQELFLFDRNNISAKWSK